MKNLVLVILCSMFAGECVARRCFERICIDRRPGFIDLADGSGQILLYTEIAIFLTKPNEIIFGINASFEGPMNQVNPLGMATPFSDLNGFFGEVPVSHDSQFLFSSQDFSPPALAVSETENSLSAAMTNLPEATGGDGTRIELARIVAYSNNVYFRFSLDIRDRAGTPVRNPVLTGSVFVFPEPGTISLLTMAAFGLVGVRRRRVA